MAAYSNVPPYQNVIEKRDNEMTITITKSDTSYLAEAAGLLTESKNIVALTGAGISVESGIDDFRSPGGLWSHFPPEEYGTIEVFKRNPEKAWKLFRTLGKGLMGKKPNDGHRVLAGLEGDGNLKGIVTQNIDNLHQDAGSRRVIEIHGDHKHLQCIECGYLCEGDESVLDESSLPRCVDCSSVLKPNVVLFGEQVRALDEINVLLHRCDLLLVIGTSAQVYPAASIPQQVKIQGGSIFEFNKVETVLTNGDNFGSPRTDYFFKGNASTMLKLLTEELPA